MTAVTVEIQPLGQAEEVQVVGDLDELFESNACSCSAGDANPY